MTWQTFNTSCLLRGCWRRCWLYIFGDLLLSEFHDFMSKTMLPLIRHSTAVDLRCKISQTSFSSKKRPSKKEEFHVCFTRGSCWLINCAVKWCWDSNLQTFLAFELLLRYRKQHIRAAAQEKAHSFQSSFPWRRRHSAWRLFVCVWARKQLAGVKQPIT